MTTVSAVFSEPSATPAYANRRNKSNRSGFKPQSAHQRETVQQQQPNNDNSYPRRFKPKISPSSPSEQTEPQTSSLYKFKLNRQPGRWQYKTSPKPRVTIRKQVNDEAALAVTPSHEALQEQQSNPDDAQTNVAAAAPAADARVDETDLDSSSSVNGDVLNDSDTLDNAIENKKVLIETLKVEISTPADFKDTYYEIATIKSPYTYQVSFERISVSVENRIKFSNCPQSPLGWFGEEYALHYSYIDIRENTRSGADRNDDTDRPID